MYFARGFGFVSDYRVVISVFKKLLGKMLLNSCCEKFAAGYNEQLMSYLSVINNFQRNYNHEFCPVIEPLNTPAKFGVVTSVSSQSGSFLIVLYAQIYLRPQTVVKYQ